MTDILVRKRLTKRDLAQSKEHPGRRPGRSHGSWITDLAELHKAIILCDACSHRFNPLRYGYYRQREFAYIRGKCDACKNFCVQANLFLHETNAWMRK